MKWLCEIDGRLAAELDDDALGLLPVQDVQHVFGRQRLEVEAVGDIEVGGDGLGVVVDDDGGVARFTERPDAVDAGIIELNSLADADGAGAEHDHFLAGFRHRERAGYRVQGTGFRVYGCEIGTDSEDSTSSEGEQH